MTNPCYNFLSTLVDIWNYHNSFARCYMKKWLIVLLAVLVLFVSGCPESIVSDIYDELLVNAPFLPNSGGTIGPFVPFERSQGIYGMLYIDTVERNNNAFTEGPYFEVGLWFATPQSIGATSYTLQYSSDGEIFQTFQGSEGDLTTGSATQDNFSISPGATYYYRLAIAGGEFDGWYSNSVYAPYTDVDTYWGGYSYNADMANSDPPVMVPYVGNARVISMTANTLEAGFAQIDYTPTYQWYRLNPMTFEMVEITGATGTTYTTTNADAGYHLLVRGTGNETTVGGFQQVLDGWDILIGNKSYAVDADLDGFYLVLEHAVSGLSADDFVLYEYDFVTEIPITSLTAVEGHVGMYRIDATIPAEEQGIILESTSDFWTLKGRDPDMPEEHPWYQHLPIVL